MYSKWKEDKIEAAARGESLAPNTPAKAVGKGSGKSVDDNNKRGSVAASLTREWNWSTF